MSQSWDFWDLPNKHILVDQAVVLNPIYFAKLMEERFEKKLERIQLFPNTIDRSEGVFWVKNRVDPRKNLHFESN